MISETPCKSLPVISRVVGLDNGQSLHHFFSNLPWSVEALRQRRLSLLKRALTAEHSRGKIHQVRPKEEIRGRLEEAMAQRAEERTRTEQALRQLDRQLEGLVCDISEIAYIVLHEVLKREFGWEVGVLERTRQKWSGKTVEVTVFGQARDPNQPDQTIWIVGEAKHNLTSREVAGFARQVELARQHLQGKVFSVCFCYRARPEVREKLQELGIPLVFSYGRMA